jgi:acetyl esterase/lipase
MFRWVCVICLAVGLATAQQNVPTPTHANLDYAPAEPVGTVGHKLDLYIPSGLTRPAPIVIWTGGSAWLSDDGKRNAGENAARELNQAGYALAGVSIRSSSQVKFPGQVHDIKAAIRWLRANAAKYNLDPTHIAIMCTSSGGWATLMAAVTGDVPELEGTLGTTSVSSSVQAAVAFYPPTNFLNADAWAPTKCTATRPIGRDWMPGDCHVGDSPESRMLGCEIETCPERVAAADPTRYISAADPPIMILHGQSDPAVPHNQGEQFYNGPQ